MTILNLMKMVESYPNGLKTLWDKEKLHDTSNFSFFHSVFKRLVSQGHQKVSLCGNGLTLVMRNNRVTCYLQMLQTQARQKIGFLFID